MNQAAAGSCDNPSVGEGQSMGLAASEGKPLDLMRNLLLGSSHS